MEIEKGISFFPIVFERSRSIHAGSLLERESEWDRETFDEEEGRRREGKERRRSREGPEKKKSLKGK